MTVLKNQWFALALVLVSGFATAASSVVDSGLNSLSTSIGSISGSVQNSSDSSSRATHVAEGDYQLMDVTPVAERPGMMRLQLQALADTGPDGQLLLLVPQQTVSTHQLQAGQRISARQRPYGVEFALAPQHETFFLVLADAWYRELQTVPVTL